MKIRKPNCCHLTSLGAVLLLLLLQQQVAAQFLFTYEINSESDDSRAPKSSLFDPSSFKIVTPAQLQSTYNRLATASQTPPPVEQEATSGAITPTRVATVPVSEAPPHQHQHQHQHQDSTSPSFLKQTSAALQSFAELFQLAPNSAPPSSPLQAATGAVGQLHRPQVEQQAEARSLHEHWTQQQQRAHAPSSQQAPSPSPPVQHSFIASTVPSANQQQQNQQAAYWLTANPLASDGNFLVQVKQQQQQRSAGQSLDNLLSMAAPTTGGQAAPSSQMNSAQNSFLSSSTPTSYYPGPTQNVVPKQATSQQQPTVHSHQARSLPPTPSSEHHLRPPANTPEHFELSNPAHRPTASPILSSSINSPHHHQLKSAEESLLEFRKSQLQQQEQTSNNLASNSLLPSSPHHNEEEPTNNQQQQQQQQNEHLMNDIPKVSPQIYESFLLQQKDQFEKHMELLKQQQELNRLLEQKQKKLESDKKLEEQAKRRKAKELEMQRKKQLEEERKLKEEQQARELAKRREQEELARRQELERRRRIELEAARRQQLLAEQRERETKELEMKQLEERREKEAREHLLKQEQLRKLLELQRRRDEEEARRQKLATESSRALEQQPQRLQASRLALEHRERGAASLRSPTSGWGVPIRSLRSQENSPGSSSTSAPFVSSQAPMTTSTTGSSSLRRQATSVPASAPRRSGRPQQEKLIRQKIPLYSGAGKYGLYRGSLANDTTLAELAALLDSVTLPSSTSTTTTTTTSTTTPAPTEISAGPTSSPASSINFDDDDVPRRPSRRTAALQHRSTSTSSPSINFSPTSTTSGNRSQNRTTSSSSSRANIGLASLPADSDNDGIPGRAGIEYPVLAEVPRTSFSCAKQPLNGYYADTETACQVVHLCQAGVQSSILCPNGTIFNQEKFSCQWWYEVNCSRAPIFYQLNDNLYKALPATSAKDSDTFSSSSSAQLQTKPTTTTTTTT